MKKLIAIVSLLMTVAFVLPVLAHMGNVSAGRYQMMQNMMGENTVEIFQDLEKEMMGSQNQEQMETLLEKMFSGTLTSDEQKEMTEIMKSSAGNGANLMMMRFMMPQAAAKTGFGNYGMMNGMMGSWGQSFTWTYWVTVILAWIVLILSIAALWRYLNKT